MDGDMLEQSMASHKSNTLLNLLEKKIYIYIYIPYGSINLRIYLAFSCSSNHSCVIPSKVRNSTASPHPRSHPANRSTIPITWVIPLVSGCIKMGKTKLPSPPSTWAFSHSHKNMSFHLCSTTRASTCPWLLSRCGKYCNAIISSLFQPVGISTSGWLVGRESAAASDVGRNQVLAGWEKSTRSIGGSLGVKYGCESWWLRDESYRNSNSLRSSIVVSRSWYMGAR